MPSLLHDVVDVDRMLGVIPVSNTRRWLASCAVIEQLNPAVLVPGNGSRTHLELEREQGAPSWTSRSSAPVVPTAGTPSR